MCIIFRYPNEVDTVTWTWNQTHGAKSVLWLTLAQPFSRASIEYLPVYTPSSEEKENPTLYAANVSQGPLIIVFLHPGISHALIGRSDSTPRILTLTLILPFFLGERCYG